MQAGRGCSPRGRGFGCYDGIVAADRCSQSRISARNLVRGPPVSAPRAAIALRQPATPRVTSHTPFLPPSSASLRCRDHAGHYHSGEPDASIRPRHPPKLSVHRCRVSAHSATSAPSRHRRSPGIAFRHNVTAPACTSYGRNPGRGSIMVLALTVLDRPQDTESPPTTEYRKTPTPLGVTGPKRHRADAGLVRTGLGTFPVQIVGAGVCGRPPGTTSHDQRAPLANDGCSPSAAVRVRSPSSQP